MANREVQERRHSPTNRKAYHMLCHTIKMVLGCSSSSSRFQRSKLALLLVSQLAHETLCTVLSVDDAVQHQIGS